MKAYEIYELKSIINNYKLQNTNLFNVSSSIGTMSDVGTASGWVSTPVPVVEGDPGTDPAESIEWMLRSSETYGDSAASRTDEVSVIGKSSTVPVPVPTDPLDWVGRGAGERWVGVVFVVPVFPALVAFAFPDSILMPAESLCCGGCCSSRASSGMLKISKGSSPSNTSWMTGPLLDSS